MAQNPIVTVPQGQLKGKIATDHRGGNYYSFQGIPYGKPPIGELRFKAPQPAQPWSGVLDATKERSECVSRHILFQNILGSEDCLFLNVYTPQLPSANTALKPVMVWIHGGAFTHGSGNLEFYGPDFLLPEDVVVVTINYRLGFLGFLNFQQSSLGVPGNAGLKDQVLALEWVQRNIAKFNGNPNNVTIFGESAGGTSVHCLVLSPMAKGLFHKAIAQSGSSLSGWARAQKSAVILGKILEIDENNEEAIFKYLKDLPPEKIIEIQDKIPDDFLTTNLRPYGFVVETVSKEPAFFAEEPIDIIKSGKFNQVPLMIGFTSREGMLSEITTKKSYGELRLIKDFEKAVPYDLKLLPGSQLLKNVSQQIKRFYYGTEEPSDDCLDKFYLLQTDNFFLRPIHDTAKHHAAFSSTPIYLYRMSLESQLNLFKKVVQIATPGVCHGDDVSYLFKNQATPEIRPETIEDDAVKRFTKLWTTFARNGDPNPLNDDFLINVTWRPIQKDKLHFLDIGENLTVGVNPEARRMAFWDKIYNISSPTSKL